ncbi:MAG: hypothetical protein ACK4UO_14200 [Pseudolabrys sp.]
MLLQAALLFTLLGCVVTPQFDQAVRDGAIQLKADTLALVDKSGSRYATQQAAVDALLARYAKAADDASKIENNKLVIGAWQVIRGESSGSAGEFFAMWKRNGTIRPAFRTEKRAQLARHFDYLVCLEDLKQGGQKDCPNPLAPPAAAPAATESEGGQ